ncbi:MAG: hypothetical protein ACT6FF_06905 [Methanosarcinaceae archaeon]
MTAIAIEGFNVENAKHLSDEAMDIADLVQYYGGKTFASAIKLEVLQFKYSPTRPEEALTASDLQKTLTKFVAAQNDIENEIGHQSCEKKTEFQFVSNRPVGDNLQRALYALRNGGGVTGHVKTQLETLQAAIDLKGEKLNSFLDRFSIIGKNTTCQGITGETYRILSHLSGSPDPLTCLRLLEVQNLLRQKAGCDGAPNNCVSKVDILGALNIGQTEDLYPAPDSFPKVPVVLNRDFSASLIDKILVTKRPIIIHGPGGIGKTVVMQSLEKKLSENNETILFDGFGGGLWRAPSDQRHLAKRSLLHIINSLAAKNLCDLLLPSTDDGTILRTAIKRLNQAVTTLRETDPQKNIVLLLDAIDHSGMRSNSENTASFAKELLKELDINPIDGIVIVASCRTERRKEAHDQIDYPDFQIPIFSDYEIRQLVKARSIQLNSSEEAILISQSGGNPRCVDMMLKNNDLLNTPSVEGNEELLNALLEQRFKQAIQHAKEKGSFTPEGESFIASLRLLPPPVPMNELAKIFDVPLQSIQSFVSDLYPLIEATQYGLIFRDEPTETLAKKYADKNFRETDQFIQGLKEQQSKSAYCARALPNLLIEFDRPDDLIELAFSDIFPGTATSTVAKRNIKLARISAAINGCIEAKKYDDIFTLLIEAATIANGTQRSDRYILEFPDLAVASNDPEIHRRVFETKSAWRGARISSQSLAFAFTGLNDEAIAKGNLGIEWLNWGLSQVDEHGFQKKGLSQTEDWYGAIYVMLLNGGLKRILNWLDNRDVTFAYNFLKCIFDFLVLHSKESEQAENCLNNIIKQAYNEKNSNHYCLCAIILHFPLTIRQERKLIRILAHHAFSPEEKEERFWTPGKESSLREALLFIVIRAIKNKQRKEAKEILAKIFYSGPKDYEFGYGNTYQWKNTFWVLYSSVNAVLKRRKPNIGDFLPEEVREKLSKSALSKGPKKIEEAISNLFSHKTKRKDVFDYQRRTELERTIKERAKPLVEISQWICSIITPSKAQTAENVLEALSTKINAATNYPYQDQKLFLTRIGFFAIFNATTQSKNWTSESAEQYAEWLEKSELKNHSDLTEIVAEWSSVPSTQRASLKLSKYACNLIKQETDTQSKIDDLAYLARAVWHVSKYEAGELFKQGIELADKLGSEDYPEIESLIHCAQEYNGSAFTDEELHNFNRICELNFPYETEKFIWVGYGKAMAKIGGAKALPIISRLADRGVINLEYTLGPLLSYLIEHDKLNAELACPLLGVDEIAEPWDWDLSDFFENAFSKLSQCQKQSFAVWIAKEYDRTYTSSPPVIPLNKLKKLLDHNGIKIPTYPHFNNLSDGEKSHNTECLKETIKTFNTRDEFRPIDFDPTNFESLNKDISEEITQSSNAYTVWRRCARIIDGISNLDDILKFTQHLAELDAAPLKDILKTYETIKDEWGSLSGALNQIIKDGTLKAISQSSSDFFTDNWGLSSLLRDICSFTPGQQKEAICKVLKAIGSDLNDFESSQWMRFAASLAGHISDTALEKGLKRYLQIRVNDVPKELGDSEWSSIYEPPFSSEDITATFLWNQLGSPYTSLRWRAAHAVIRNAEFGNSNVTEKLIEKFDTTNALPFHSPDLPFYYHHARLWLLISLSKIAAETPLALVPISAKIIRLSKLAGDHCLQKFYAVNTLQKIKDCDPSFSYGQELEEQKKLITPIGTIKREVGSSPRADSYMGRPDDVPEPELEFYFDYDFKKHEINHLGSRFGIHTWQVADDMKNIIADWERDVNRSHECPRNISSEERVYDEQQPYGYYLGYHALFVAAGRYVKAHPIIKVWSDDTWEEWLKQYILSGSWLSDSIDYFPSSLPASGINLEVYEETPTLKERKSLAAQVSGQHLLSDANEITVSGNWSDKEGINYRVSSALIEPSKVRGLAYALMAQSPWHNYLPINDDDFHDPWSSRGLKTPLSPLIGECRDESTRMDEYDPYGIDGASEWLQPREDIINDLGLTFSNTDGKKWVTKENNVIFSSRIWGAKFGRGRHRHSNKGSDLKCSRDGLESLLQKRKKSLIVLVKAEKYHEHKETDHKFINKSVVVIMSANGEIRAVQKLPKVIKDAAEKMQPHHRCDVMDCYDMVLKHLKKETD